ncbi:MAG: tetratricopeptide repeat protein [Deltaproteobacteria bacterium]|nr:tetratricopeptide repeat protein [Deltaproteobacteria bacterium]
MMGFCPSCDRTTQADPGTGKCPTCHGVLAFAPETAPVEGGARRPPWLPILAGVLVLGAVAAGLVWRGTPAPAAATASKAVTAEASDVASTLRSHELTGARAVAPGVADEAMVQFARQSKDISTLGQVVRGLEKPGGLQRVALGQRRKHAVRTTAELFQAVRANKAEPVHAIEAAWLAWSLLHAAGAAPQFVAETDGVQTPLLLSRTRLGVRLADGKIVEPFATQPMVAPKGVSNAQAVAMWLVLRANVERLRSEYTLAYQDLAAAEAIAPTVAAARFVRGVTQLDQRMTDQGLATCEAALAQQQDPLARLFLAEVALANDQPVKALQRCDEALAAAPGLPEALVTKAQVLIGRMQTLPIDQRDAAGKDIAALLDQALKADPVPSGARATRAQLLLIQKEDQAAENLLRSAVLQHKEVESALLLAELHTAHKRHAEAAQVLQDVGAPLDDARIALAWVQALMADGKRDKALELMEKAFAQAPDDRTIGLLRAQLLAENGKTKEAIAALDGLRSGDDGDQIVLLQAQLLIQDNQADRAAANLDKLRERRPADKKVALLSVVALARSARLADAEKVAQQVQAAKVATAMDLAETWLQAQQLAKAIAVIEPEVAGDKPEAQVAATLAVMYVMADRKADAIALRDRVAGKLGPQAQQFRTTIDEAIAAAEQEQQGRAVPDAKAAR